MRHSIINKIEFNTPNEALSQIISRFLSKKSMRFYYIWEKDGKFYIQRDPHGYQSVTLWRREGYKTYDIVFFTIKNMSYQGGEIKFWAEKYIVSETELKNYERRSEKKKTEENRF